MTERTDSVKRLAGFGRGRRRNGGVISAGGGNAASAEAAPACLRPSSARISLHIPTHSLQMCTEGPVMSLSTCSAPFPQKEQRGAAKEAVERFTVRRLSSCGSRG